MLYQFKSMAIAHKFEAIRLKNQSRGKSSFSYLYGFVDLQGHSKMLIKKMVNNPLVQECFQKYLIEVGIMTQQDLT